MILNEFFISRKVAFHPLHDSIREVKETLLGTVERCTVKRTQNTNVPKSLG